MIDARPDRRRILGRLLSGAAAGASMSASAWGGHAAALRPGLDPVRDLALIHRKLVWSADATPTFSWLHGVRYALIDNRLLPLWAMHVGNVFRTRDLPDGYEVTVLSISVYTDLKTGRFLRRFVNPVTGAEVEIGYFPPRPQRVVYGPTARGVATAGPLARLDQHAEFGPAWIDGETVSVWGDYRAYSAESSPPTAIRVNDLSTYLGRLGEVADPEIANPASTAIFNDINTWPAWLGMGDRPGSYVSRAWGRKAFAYADLPEVWRDIVEREHPAISRDPIGALDRVG
jgi:hypothetical protein